MHISFFSPTKHPPHVLTIRVGGGGRSCITRPPGWSAVPVPQSAHRGAPDARPAPGIGWADVKAMIPVSICAAGAHCSSVFALGAGAVSFAQIVKVGDPLTGWYR